MRVIDLIYALLERGYKSLDILSKISSTLGNKALCDEVSPDDFKRVEKIIESNQNNIDYKNN